MTSVTQTVIAATALLFAIRYRSNHRVLRCRSSSKSVVEKFKLALASIGVRLVTVRDPTECVDFVWCSSKRSAFTPTNCWNRLCGSKCLEDKRVFGEITKGCEGFLESYSITNEASFEQWRDEILHHPSTLKTRWVLKDARANGGAGLWFVDVLNEGSLKAALDVVNAGGSEAGFTMQEYLPGQPMLWNGRKFHFRVGAIITATGRAFVHRTAFVHPANSAYTDDITLLQDRSVHVTNLCVNLALEQPDRFVGEVREDLITDRPYLWPKILMLWSRTVAILRPFTRFQRCRLDFEYVGLDILANENGEVVLVEANCPPATSSATGYAHAEAIHSEILGDICKYFVMPVVNNDEPKTVQCGGFTECTTLTTTYPTRDQISFLADYHSAQAKCDMTLMRFLRSVKKTKKSS